MSLCIVFFLATGASTGLMVWAPTFIYDRFAVNGSGQALLNTALFPNPSAALAAEHPDRMAYFQLTPMRQPTLAKKFQQLKETGVVLLIGAFRLKSMEHDVAHAVRQPTPA